MFVCGKLPTYVLKKWGLSVRSDNRGFVKLHTFSGCEYLFAGRENSFTRYEHHLCGALPFPLFLFHSVAIRAGVRIADRPNTEASVFSLSKSARRGAKFVYIKCGHSVERRITPALMQFRAAYLLILRGIWMKSWQDSLLKRQQITF